VPAPAGGSLTSLLALMAFPGCFFLLLLTSTVARGEYGVVHVVSENWSKDYCILFSSDYVTLPRDLHHAPLLPLHDGRGGADAWTAHPTGRCGPFPIGQTLRCNAQTPLLGGHLVDSPLWGPLS
uniref:Uncharacterized protein n=1 Tax=Ursus maritimus TaxID=29073 RepID=A0A452UKI2_URSMA